VGDSPGPGTPSGQAALESRPLRAYLASALTGLDDVEREQIFAASDAIAAACSATRIELYQPRASTDPVHHPEVADRVVYRTDRERVLASDLLLYLADRPSTGAGQELVFAHEAMIPIAVVAHQQARVSRMVTGMVSDQGWLLRYGEVNQLEERLAAFLAAQLPAIATARTARWRSDAVGFGTRLAELRRCRQLSRERLAGALPPTAGVDAETLAGWEREPARLSNPSLLQLIALAEALEVDLGDLLSNRSRLP